MADREPEIIQIKASAGSGKTYTLTKHYLEMLRASTGAGVPRPGFSRFPHGSRAYLANDILAITFTNAAASEMRARIIRRLKEDALGLSGQGDRIFESGEAKKWLDAILRDMSAMNIRTIDSLLHLIVRASSLDLGLTPDYEPVFGALETLSPRQEYFLLKCMDEEGEARRDLEKAMSVMMSQAGIKSFYAGSRLSTYLGDLLEDVLAGIFDDLTDADTLQYERQKMRDNLEKEAVSFFELVDKLDIGLNMGKIGKLPMYARSPEEWPEEIPKSAQKSSVAEICKKKESERGIPAELEAAYQKFAASVRNWHENGEAFSQAVLYYHLVQLAKKMEQAFFKDKPEEYRLPNVKISGIAKKALDFEHGVSDALCRLGTRLDNLLIDEFQDTSADQWVVLHSLVHEALSSGGSMTFVGDVKQSIYGFRNGDPSLFESVLKDPELTSIVPKPKRRELSVNWRSNEVIVKHTNHLFGALKDKAFAEKILAALLGEDLPSDILENGAKKLAATYDNVEQRVHRAGSGGYVGCEQIDGANAEEIHGNVSARIVELIRDNLGARRPYSDILILVRANSQASQTAGALLEANIPVVTENSLLLKVNPLIIQTLAFLKFINDPRDNLEFWIVITGSIFMNHPLALGLDLEKLHAWRLCGYNASDCQRFAADYDQIWSKTFAPFIRHPLLRTPYDTIREWYRLMDVENRFPNEKIFIRRFLEILYRAETSGFATISAFLNYWENNGENEKAPMPDSMDAVRIMTIHKAKGLEAPVVILPWANFAINGAEKPTRLETGGKVIAVRPSRGVTPKAYYEYMVKQAIESLNMFYVAITRPREELYILYQTTANKSRKSLSPALELMFAGLPSYTGDLPYALGTLPASMGEKNNRENIKQSEPEICGEATDKSNPPLPDDGWYPMRWAPRLKIFRSPSMEADMKAGERGTFMHFCLQYMSLSGNPKADAEKAFNFALEKCGVHVPDNEQMRGSILDGLEWFAGLEQSALWLANGISEQSMTDEEGRLFRADLIMPQPDGICVIDYKSGNQEEKHVEQVLNYLNCIEKSGEYEGKHRGLLVYLDKKKFLLVEEGKKYNLTSDCPV